MVLPSSMERTKQVSLIAYPSEIISRIVGDLDKSSLSRLALSSRFLNGITTPILYDHIDFPGHSRNWSSPESIAFRNLTVLLLERPHLAGYVHHFTMRNDFRRESQPKHSEIARLPQALLTAIEAASHSKEEERQWLEDLSSTEFINEDALVALLLPSLQNLKTLDLRVGEGIIYFTRMMQRASRKEKPFDTTPAFENLSDIMYVQHGRVQTSYDMEKLQDDDDDDDDDDDGRPCFITPALLAAMPLPLPAVSRLFGLKSGFQMEMTNRAPIFFPPAWGLSPRLSHLKLRECRMSSQIVMDVLRVPAALKIFIYEVIPKNTSSTVFNINTHRAMEHQMSSLEKIWLDCVPWDEELKRFYQFNHAKPMPSFANFKNLRTLRIASPFLFGSIALQQGDGGTDLLAPLLPDSLDTLHITRCDHVFDFVCKELKLLLERLTNTTHLSKIIIEDPSLGGFSRGPTITRLADLAKSKNISLSTLKGGPEHHADDEHDWKGLGIDGSLPWTETARGDYRSYSEKVFDAQSGKRR